MPTPTKNMRIRRAWHRLASGMVPDGYAVVVEQVGAAFVLREAQVADPGLVRFASTLPVRPPTLVVSAGRAADAVVLDRVAEFVSLAASRGEKFVRVVPWGPLPRAAELWWQRLADFTGVELLIRSGPVRVTGAAVPADGLRCGVTGTWWSVAPFSRPCRLGAGEPVRARRTVPGWDGDGLVAHIVPAGVVLLPRNASPEASWSALPPEPGRFVVFAGSRGSEPADATGVARYLASLPEDVRADGRLVVPNGRDVVRWGSAVAEALGEDVTVANGVPNLRDDAVETTLVDSAGTPTWAPFLEDVRCRARAVPAAVPHRWRHPMPGLVPCGPAMFRTGTGMSLTVTVSGLWLRCSAWHDDPSVVGSVADPASMVVAVGQSHEPVPDGLWPALAELLDYLDPPTLRRCKVLVLGEPAEGGRDAVETLARLRAIPLRLAA